MLEVTNEVSALHEVESIAALNLHLGSPSQSSNVKLLNMICVCFMLVRLKKLLV